MQTQPNAIGPGGLVPASSPLAMLAQPKVVLMAAGLVGLAIDLFVRPLSWVALALIVLATAPWILQAWSQRPGATQRGLAPARAKAVAAAEPADKPHPEQRIVPTVQRAGAARTEPPAMPAREAGRAAPAAEPVVRPSATPVQAAAGEPRSAPRPGQVRAHPPAPPETAAARRPVRPEPAR